MPKLIAAGTRIGIRISIAASASMKQPTASRTTFETNRNTSGSWIVATIAGARVCGMREIDMHQPSAPATMTRTMTMPVVSAVLMRIAGRSFTDSVR